MNEGILATDFPQPSLGYFTLGDNEGVQLIIFIMLFFSCGVNLSAFDRVHFSHKPPLRKVHF